MLKIYIVPSIFTAGRTGKDDQLPSACMVVYQEGQVAFLINPVMISV